jgi:hypothetical protein
MVASILLVHEGLLGNCNIPLLGVRNFNVNGDGRTSSVASRLFAPRSCVSKDCLENENHVRGAKERAAAENSPIAGHSALPPPLTRWQPAYGGQTAEIFPPERDAESSHFAARKTTDRDYATPVEYRLLEPTESIPSEKAHIHTPYSRLASAAATSGWTTSILESCNGPQAVSASMTSIPI